MAIYGIGYNYKIEGDLSEQFLDKGIVCISSRTKTRLYFLGMFRAIEKGDIVIMKSFTIQNQILTIKAIGIVDNIDENSKEGDLGYCIKVNWLSHNSNGIKDISIDRDGGPRNRRIYREYNPEIIKQIDELVEKYKKD